MGVVWAAEAASSEGGTGYWQLAMVLLAIGLLTAFGRWRKARTPVQPMTTAKEFRERDRDANRYRDAADKALVEMLEMSRTLNAQVDTKIRILNRLVKDADDKTAALNRLLTQAGITLENGILPPASVPAEAEAGQANRPSRRLERANGFRTDLHERISVLRREGKSATEIAKATNLSTTEVRFVLDSLDAIPGDE